MKIAIIGAGGIGGYFGALLAAAGENVHFIVRSRTLGLLREQGLTVESAVTPMHLPSVQASDDPSAVGPADVVLFAVKLPDAQSAAGSAAAAARAPHAGDPLPERRRGRAAAVGADRVRAGRERGRLHRGLAARARCGRARRAVRAAALRRARVRSAAGARGVSRRLPARRHRRADRRRHPQGDLGKVRVPGRPLRDDRGDTPDRSA